MRGDNQRAKTELLSKKIPNEYPQRHVVSLSLPTAAPQIDPATYGYKTRGPAQAILEAQINMICQTKVRFTCLHVHVLLRPEGLMISWKKPGDFFGQLVDRVTAQD